MSNASGLAYQWWAQLDDTDRQRVRDIRHSRHGRVPGDLVESMAGAGVAVVSDGSWSCVSVGPAGFTLPAAVRQLLELPELPQPVEAMADHQTRAVA